MAHEWFLTGATVLSLSAVLARLWGRRLAVIIFVIAVCVLCSRADALTGRASVEVRAAHAATDTDAIAAEHPCPACDADLQGG
ncbi:hypothetical protein SDC9_198012 [bioreactor metagenome]|uniref:Uncharacterized protein n=1 Tax=bioreactor metagenome TaxID=1076179 RepID=A0A645IHB6_9ZZZZ